MHQHVTFRGSEIKFLRVRAGVRQYRVAQELGISPTTLADWENGRRPVPPRQGQRIIEAIERLSGCCGLRGGCNDLT